MKKEFRIIYSVSLFVYTIIVMILAIISYNKFINITTSFDQLLSTW